MSDAIDLVDPNDPFSDPDNLVKGRTTFVGTLRFDDLRPVEPRGTPVDRKDVWRRILFCLGRGGEATDMATHRAVMGAKSVKVVRHIDGFDSVGFDLWHKRLKPEAWSKLLADLGADPDVTSVKLVLARGAFDECTERTPQSVVNCLLETKSLKLSGPKLWGT